MFLLRPDSATNNAFIYCLAVAAALFGIDVLFTLAESIHHHTVIFDRYGHVSRFSEHFHKLVARSQNALRGRWEKFWAAGEPCVTRLLDPETVIKKIVYAATNPVKDRLVERVHHWPGASSLAAFLHGREMIATRPGHFFRNPGPMPKTVRLRIVIPSELGPADDVIRQVRAGIDATEKQVAADRDLLAYWKAGYPRSRRTVHSNTRTAGRGNAGSQVSRHCFHEGPTGCLASPT